jgi:hypothetical protein
LLNYEEQYYAYSVDTMAETPQPTIRNRIAKVITSPLTKSVPIISSAWSGGSSFVNGVQVQMAILMNNPFIDTLIGVGSILIFGYIYKSAMSSVQHDTKYTFLAQTVHIWFVLLAILYIANNILK